jgi:hypothetical protein
VITLKLICLPLLLPLVLLLLASCGGASQVADTQSQAEESTASGFLDPKQFFNDLGQNIVAAKAEYSGRSLLVAGIVGYTGAQSGLLEDDGNPLINIKFRDAEGMGGWLQAMIICIGPDRDTVSKLQGGDSITVEGIGTRMNQYGATLEPCSIVSHTES